MTKLGWFFACCGLASSVSAQTMHQQALSLVDPVGELMAAAPKLGPVVAAKARIDMLPAEIGAADTLSAMAAYNAAGRLPTQNGIGRNLWEPLVLDPLEAVKGSGVHGWSARVGVEGAWRLRLRLDSLDLPAGATAWVWGEGEAPRAFGVELRDDEGGAWTPSVGGSVLYLHVEWPDGPAPQLTASQFLQLYPSADPLAPAAEKTACLRDATCVNSGEFPGIAIARSAIAHMQYVKNGSSFVCTGGLLNDTNNATTVLLFLTANHCFSSQSSASSLEAFWDYKSSSCGGNWPNINGLSRSNGSTLLATSSNTDVTLIRLNSVPAGRSLLGWDSRSSILTENLKLHRVSHPFPDDFNVPAAQAYTRTRLRNSISTCSSLPRPRYLYSAFESGGQYGGSSGSPIMIDSGQVVGQLYGVCGTNIEDGCDWDANDSVDGSLAQSYSLLEPFLNPTTGGNTTPCVAGTNTLCVSNNTNDKRFEVKVQYGTGGPLNNATAVGLGSIGVNRGGIFYFSNSSNPELLIKVLNACTVNNRFWIYYAATTDLEMRITVRDTKDGSTKTYTNPRGTPAPPITDTNAFATCP